MGKKSGIYKNNSQYNFVLIQVESLDAHIINKTYKGRFVTPFLHSWSQKCIYYLYMLAYHAAGGSSDCEVAVINSIESLEMFPTTKLVDYDYSNSFLKSLKMHSFKTVAFHGNNGEFFNRNVAFKKMGFDSFYDLKRLKLNENGWGQLMKTYLIG